MKCVRVTVKKLEVDSVSIKDGAELSIYFDDGARKCLKYSTMLKNIDEDVKNIFTKINVYEKAQNKVLDPGDILESFISVLIENEEDAKEKIKTFLGRLGENQKTLRNYGTHQGYIANLNRMQKKVLELKPSTIRNE
ncbi:hypothetical protein KY362_03735 [Candidatus Woesearchaeota archaeon]|nr:hypothetical protein [Candidatus Woesearchaeota archaeon]